MKKSGPRWSLSRLPGGRGFDMTSFAIRAVQSADLPGLLQMIEGLAAHHGDGPTARLEDLERDLLGPHPWLTGLVGEVEEGLGGYALLCPTAQVQFGVRGMDLHHLFVRPASRRQGLGRALVGAAITEARLRSCRFLTVGTAPDNRAAQEFYLSAGLTQRPSVGPRFSIRW